MFLQSYGNSREILGELKTAVETLSCVWRSDGFSRSSKLSLVLPQLYMETRKVFLSQISIPPDGKLILSDSVRFLDNVRVSNGRVTPNKQNNSTFILP